MFSTERNNATNISLMIKKLWWYATFPFRLCFSMAWVRNIPMPPYLVASGIAKKPKSKSKKAGLAMRLLLRELRWPGSLYRLNRVFLLRSQLWGGAPDFAVARLESIFKARFTDPLSRLQVALALSTWYDYQGDAKRAMEVLESLEHAGEGVACSKQRIIRMVVLHAAEGRLDRAKDCLAHIEESARDQSDYHLIHSNLASDEQSRLEHINRCFQRRNLAPLRLLDAGRGLSLDNLTTDDVKAEIEMDELVSVIMPVYNAVDTIATALRSLQRQTHQALEIIVVDDCSSDGTADVVASLAKEDSRIQLIQQKENLGAYACRNAGLAASKGRFITTHDADDWSHPQKIENQLRVLDENKRKQAVVTHWARVRRPFLFTTNWRLTHEIIHWSHSSLMFRRGVYERLGGWDPVIVSGDTEFIWRIESAYGRGSMVKLFRDVPMAFALDEETSLTRNKLTHASTIYFGLRHYYREISRYWLSRYPKGLSKKAQIMKWRMLPDEIKRRETVPIEVDLWIKGDLTRREVMEQIRREAQLDQGKSIGITHELKPFDYGYSWGLALKFCRDFFRFMEEEERAKIILPGVQVHAGRIIEIGDTSIS
jgi:glycosyltransferase involved in cell wall biosynthesis